MTENIEPIEEQKRGPGNVTDYTPELFQRVLDGLIEGKSLKRVCEEDDSLPNKATVYRWLYVDEDLRDQYIRAREFQAHVLFDETVDIADDSDNDYVERKRSDGSEYFALDKEAVMRSKLRVDTRVLMASKLAPKKYGDSATIRQQLLNSKGDPTDHVERSSDIVKDVLKRIMEDTSDGS